MVATRLFENQTSARSALRCARLQDSLPPQDETLQHEKNDTDRDAEADGPPLAEFAHVLPRIGQGFVRLGCK